MFELHHCGTQRLETCRLILRAPAAQDTEALFRNLTGSERVTRYLPWPVHRSAEETFRFFGFGGEQAEDPAEYTWGIERKEEPGLIGIISVVGRNGRTAAAELGWYLAEAFWGQGIMTEAACAVRDFLFDRVGFRRLEAGHDRNNPASGRVMQKIGMRCEGVRRAAGFNNTGICDTVIYGMLREDRQQSV